MRAIKSVLLFCVFVMTFFLASRMLASTVQAPPADWERRIAYFKSNHERYDFVCIGSSRVFHNLDPSIIESVLANEDCAPRGFNVGVPGFQGHGIDHIVRTLGDALEDKVIIIEAFSYVAKMPLDGGGRFTQIEKKWHSPYQMISVVRTAFDKRLVGRLTPIPESKIGTTKRIIISLSNLRHRVAAGFLAMNDVYPHLRLFMLEQVPIGSGLNVPALGESFSGKNVSQEDFEKDKGFRLPPEAQRPEDFERSDWLKKVDAVLNVRAPSPFSGPNDWAFWNQVEFLETKNPRGLFYVIFPHSYLDSPRWLKRFERVAASAGGPAQVAPILLNYNQPELYPEFFEYDARFDSTHLNGEAIRLFSRRVAEDVAGSMDSPCPW